MTTAAELALAIVGLTALCVVLCCAVAHAVTRWLDPRRWEASTTASGDLGGYGLGTVLTAESIVRNAARRIAEEREKGEAP